MIDKRLAGKARRPGSSGSRRFWLALAVMFAICALAVYRSALFRLDSVEVTGAKRLTDARVMEVAGLAPGQPRWEHPAAVIEQRLREEPWVLSATAEWQWSRVKIDLLEREPVGLLRYKELFYLSLDESGRILELLDLKAGSGLPVVSGVTLTNAVRGQQLRDQGLSDALTVLASMAQPLRNQVSEIQVEADRALTLFMAGGATVQFGMVPDADKDRIPSVEQKIRLFGDYWRSISKKRTTNCHIDLRVEGLVIPSTGCQ